MSDRTVSITLTAKDGVTHTFQQVSKAGESMGDALKRAAQDASQGLDDLGESAQQSGRSMEAIRTQSRDVGLALGILASGLALSGKMFRDQEIAVQTMERGYGDAADSMLQFANALQESTNFSNDAAVAAENVFRTLSLNYGYSADQIQQLITISADLAASMGIGLEDAATRVQNAMRGEAESAEYLGLTLNDHALGIDRLSQSTSEAEKSQIRFNALQEQSAFAMGAAQQQAETSYGAMVQFKDELQDAAQGLGNLLGPLGEVGAFAADNAIKVAAMGLAIGQLAKGATAAAALTESLTGVSAGAAIAGSGIAGLAGTAGIAGLGIAATVAVTGGVGLLISKLAVDTPNAAGDAAASIQELIDLALQLDNVGAIGSDLLELKDAQTYNDAIIEITGHLNELMAVGNDLYAMSSDPSKQVLPVDDPAFAAFSHNAQLVIDSNDDMVISFEEVQAAYDAMAYDNHAMAASAADMNTAIAASGDELDTLMNVANGVGPAANYAREAVDNLIDGLLNGTVAPKDFEAALQGVIDHVHGMQEATLAGADATAKYTAANQTFVGSLQARQTAASNVAAAMAQDAALMGDAVEGNTQATQAYVSALELRMELEANVEQMTSGRNEATLLFGLSQKDAANSVTQLNAALAQQAAQFETLNDLSSRYAGREEASAKAEAAALDTVTDKWRERVDAIKQAEDAQRAADYSASREKFDSGSLKAMEAAADAAAEARATEALSRAYDALTQSYTGTYDAMKSGFSVVVGNTNAIAQQSQELADWATNLIDAEGAYSKLDDLVNNHRISGTSGVFDDGSEYAQAQQAYNSIMEDNAAIQEHVLTIQAKQAPMLADMESNLEAYLGTLADATPEQQAFALAMMDSSTSAQAFDLATGLLENRDVFGPMAESVANLNPYIGEALVQMGLMTKTLDESTGTYVYTLVADTGDAKSQTAQLTAAVEALNKTFTIAFGIEVDTGPLDDIQDKLNPFGGGSDAESSGITVSVTADASSATQIIGDVVATEIPDKTAVILGDGSDALAAIDGVNAAGDAMPDQSIAITADTSGYYANLPTTGVTLGTNYIDVVTRNLTSGTTSTGMMDGGVISYAAQGRVMTGPTVVGENGWELLLGGQGGLVVPHTASAQSVKGMSGPLIGELHVHAAGDWDEISYQVAQKLVPAIQRAVAEEERRVA